MIRKCCFRATTVRARTVKKENQLRGKKGMRETCFEEEYLSVAYPWSDARVFSVQTPSGALVGPTTRGKAFFRSLCCPDVRVCFFMFQSGPQQEVT